MKRKEKNLSWYKKKAIDLAKIKAKTRDNWTCQKCGKKKGDVQIHGSHIFPTRYGNLASDPDNIIALCASCHNLNVDSWHGSPLETAKWFSEKFPGLEECLREKIQGTPPKLKIDYWIDRYETLKEELKG
jgi:5-methylcytosine-specific restriction endonuclease McrA